MVTTLGDLRDVGQNRRGRAARHVGIGVLALVVLLGATGFLGVRSARTSSAAAGYTLTVTYGAVSRAGLDTPWQVTVGHPGGFPDGFTLATTAAYFDIFETQGLTPAPDAETYDAGRLVWDFTPSRSSTFTVTYDAYIQPGSQRGRTATTTLLVDGEPVTSVSYRTRLLP